MPGHDRRWWEPVLERVHVPAGGRERWLAPHGRRARRPRRAAPGMEHYRIKNTGRFGRRGRSRPSASPRASRSYRCIVADVDAILTSFRVAPGRWGRSEADASRWSTLTAPTYLMPRPPPWGSPAPRLSSAGTS